LEEIFPEITFGEKYVLLF